MKDIEAAANRVLHPHAAMIGGIIGAHGSRIQQRLDDLYSEMSDMGRPDFNDKWQYNQFAFTAAANNQEFATPVVIPQDEVWLVQSLILGSAGGGGASLANGNSTTTPAAGTPLASLGTLPAGTYTINTTAYVFSGVAADETNVGLYVGGVLQYSVPAGVSGPGVAYGGPYTIVVPPGGAVVQLRAIALSAAGVYLTNISATPQSASASITVLTDGGQLRGAYTVQGSNTLNISGNVAWLPGEHIVISSTAAITGTVAIIRKQMDAAMHAKQALGPQGNEMVSGRSNTHNVARDNLEQKGIYTGVPREIRAGEGLERSTEPSIHYTEARETTQTLDAYDLDPTAV